MVELPNPRKLEIGQSVGLLKQLNQAIALTFTMFLSISIV
jgi:hypothetical protein